MSTTIVIFGASGDLSWRKLIPGLYNNFIKGRLDECSNIVGYARRPYTDASFRERLKDGVTTFSSESFDAAKWEEFSALLLYFQGNLDVPDDFTRLQAYLKDHEEPGSNRLYYLATAPEHYIPVVTALGAAGMGDHSKGL